MKTLYFECNMGAAGDMLMAALLELHDNPADFLNRLNHAGIPGVSITAKPSAKCGIHGTHVNVDINGQEEDVLTEENCAHTHGHRKGESRLEHGHMDGEHLHIHGHLNSEHRHGHTHSEHTHDGHTHEHSHDKHSHDGHHHSHTHSTHHHHNGYAHIEHLIGHLNISAPVKSHALAVYQLIAEAESHAHGVPVSQIHFHEVGEMDAVADIVGVCMLLEELAPELILASPVNVGSGQVRCAHGILPVPAPATAHILQGIPIYSGQVNGELCTPTGAALLKHFVKEFCPMPVITIDKIGYGMGKKDFEKANCVRAFCGETGHTSEEVIELICNLDDMAPESIAFAQQLLLEEGALDVYTSPIGMKKGRTGLSFTCMCRTNDRDKMLALIFKHTSTLGIREYQSRRYTLQKYQTEFETKLGTVRMKTSHGFGVSKSKPEYEDIAKIARTNGMSVQDVMELLRKEKL